MPNRPVRQETVDLEAGVATIRGLEEVHETEATGPLVDTYEDIKATLRVPSVNAVFRVLAAGPPFLVPAWRHIAPIAATVAFEERADRLRVFAAERIGTVEGDLTLELPDDDALAARAFLDTVHYVTPKLLLVAELLDRVARGDHGGSVSLGGDRLPRGPAKGTSGVPLREPSAVDGAVRRTYKDIQRRHDHPLVASAYRGLANWPLVLQSAWGTIADRVETDRFLDDRAAVQREAASFTAEIAVPPISWGDTGIREADLQEVRDLLAVFRMRLIPDVLLDVTCIKAHLDGSAAVGRSRFSAARPGPHQPSGPRAPAGKG